MSSAPLASVSPAPKPTGEPAYRRILLKLSGEALMGESNYGIERETIDRIVAEIADVLRRGVQIAIVIGGGNIFRGVAPGAAGTGNPFFTTDTAAALRGREMGVDIVLKATKVDGVYTADPMKDTDARRYMTLTFDEAIVKNLKVMDATALALCRDQNMLLKVFSIFVPGALSRVVMGGDEGTLVHC